MTRCMEPVEVVLALKQTTKSCTCAVLLCGLRYLKILGGRDLCKRFLGGITYLCTRKDNMEADVMMKKRIHFPDIGTKSTKIYISHKQ